jgi:hypothetical protein
MKQLFGKHVRSQIVLYLTTDYEYMTNAEYDGEVCKCKLLITKPLLEYQYYMSSTVTPLLTFELSKLFTSVLTL